MSENPAPTIPSDKNDILDKLKTWLTAGSMSVNGIVINRSQCAAALYMLQRYINEESSESWQETIAEMQRIGKGQAEEARDLITRLAAHIPDAFEEDREEVKEWIRTNGFS